MTAEKLYKEIAKGIKYMVPHETLVQKIEDWKDEQVSEALYDIAKEEDW